LQSAIGQVKAALFWYGILVQLSLINETKTKKFKYFLISIYNIWFKFRMLCFFKIINFQGTFVLKMMAEHIYHFTSKLLFAIDRIGDA